MSAHPIIDRLYKACAEACSHDLSINQVAPVLGRERSFVSSLISMKELEALGMAAKSKRRNDGKVSQRTRLLYSIPAAAVLTYLVRHTSGDKMVILEAIRQRFPQYLPMCEALGKTPVAASAEPALIPANVIPMHGPRLKKAIKDPYEGHPQLFTA